MIDILGNGGRDGTNGRPQYKMTTRKGALTCVRSWQILLQKSAATDEAFVVVCTENLTPDVVMMKSAEDGV